jgi:protein-S-isoprenylcysteine O-methyltransferase Ste14
MWTFTNLGRQYSPLLRVRKDQLLVTSGPYAYVRHPLYTFGFPFMFGLALVAANWFVLLSAGVALTLLVTVRVPREEAMLTEAFGDAYRDYAKRTGRLLPRWRGR